jgi:hypothetical protein
MIEINQSPLLIVLCNISLFLQRNIELCLGAAVTYLLIQLKLSLLISNLH